MSNILDFVAYKERRDQESHDRLWEQIFHEWAETPSSNTTITYTVDFDDSDPDGG